jgi:TonB-linked SusC/RagA family outer membrane protein
MPDNPVHYPARDFKVNFILNLKNHCKYMKLNHYQKGSWNNGLHYTFRIMKIIVVLLLLGIGNAFSKTYSQNTLLSLDIEKRSIKEVFDIIERKSEYVFFFSENIRNELNRKVNIHVQGKTLDVVLDEIFAGTDLVYTINDRQVSVARSGKKILEPAPQQETIQVKGVVVDPVNEPLSGVNIRVKGSTNGTVTNLNGEFTLSNVLPSDVLQISYIGYVTQEKTIGSNHSFTIILVEDSQILDEIVVVGYGMQKKVNLTGAVATVNLEGLEAISRPVTNVSQILNGAIPGLQIMQGSGEPNVENFSVNIRGTGTLNSSSPLILVDGMELSMSMVNPSDIATVSILKDAASCAIYGNRGANGVILITTKNGSSGRINVTYDATFSYSEPFKIIHTVSDYATYMQLFNESQTNLGQNPTFAQSIIDTWNAAKQDPNGIASSGYPNYVAYPNIDWWDEIYTKAWMQKHTATLNGRENKTGYSMSISYTENPGVVKKTGYDRYQGRMNLYSDVTDWLRVGARIWGNVTDRDVSDSGSGFFSGIGTTKMLPCTYPYYDGKYGAPENAADDPQSHNPLWDMAYVDGYDKYTQLYTDWYAQVKFLKYFTYNFNYYYQDERREKKTVQTSIGKYSFSQGTFTTGANDPATLYTYMYYTRYNAYKVNHILNYNRTFGQHDVSALLGYEQQSYDYRVTDANKLGLTDAAVNDFNAATTPYSTTGYGDGSTARSVFGRLNYAFRNKYLFEANFRYDGSSRFAPDYRWGMFPSFSAGWRVSEEPWMKNIPSVSNFKLRASWGKLGNNSIGNYDWQSTYSTANYASGNTLVPGIAITAIANSALRWEETAVTNAGVDYGFLNNRITGSLDVYNKLTSGILYTPDMYMAMGNAAAPKQNIAEVTNRGIEFEIGWRDKIGKDFNYSIKANVAYNKNWVNLYKGKLLADKSNIGDVSTGSTTRVLEDHIISEWYLPNVYKGTGKGYAADGVNGGPVNGMIRTETDMEWLQAMQAAGYSFQPSNNVARGNLWYGEYIYADSNNDGIYGNSYDSEFQDISAMPKYNFGFQASANWKNIDFSMNWGGAAGFSIYYYSTGRNASQTVYGYAIPQIIADDHYFYDPSNPSDPRTNLNSNNARLAYSSSTPSAASSSLHLEKGDFLKLRSFTVGYTLPGFISKKALVERFRVFVTGENLFAITGFSGQDPEMRTTVGYSTMRQYAAGINVTF